MIVNTQLQSSYNTLKNTLITLRDLYSSYEESGDDDNEKVVLFSKLAVIEYCGWIEMCIDDIAKISVQNIPQNERAFKILKQEIKKVNGFNYQNDVQKLLVVSFGVVKFQRIEERLRASGSLDMIKSLLDNGDLKKSRNQAAHTYVRGVQSNYDTPSVFIGRLESLYPLLRKLHDVCSDINNAC